MKIRLFPADFIKVFNSLEAADPDTGLTCPKVDPSGSSLSLDVWVEGCSTSHSVELRADGTWHATTWVQP